MHCKKQNNCKSDLYCYGPKNYLDHGDDYDDIEEDDKEERKDDNVDSSTSIPQQAGGTGDFVCNGLGTASFRRVINGYQFLTTSCHHLTLLSFQLVKKWWCPIFDICFKSFI